VLFGRAGVLLEGVGIAPTSPGRVTLPFVPAPAVMSRRKQRGKIQVRNPPKQAWHQNEVLYSEKNNHTTQHKEKRLQHLSWRLPVLWLVLARLWWLVLRC
jgi:hypothetical protein